MTFSVFKTELKDIQPLRSLFLQEMNSQIRYDACHARGWSDSYLLTADDLRVGYGSVKGRQIEDRDTLFEYFVVPPFRSHAGALFRQLIDVSGARFIECQSNDRLFASLLYEFCSSVSTDVVLFEDHFVTEHAVPGAQVRPRRDDDRIFEHGAEPVGAYVVELVGEVVATGGFLLHYNKPLTQEELHTRVSMVRVGDSRR